MAPDFGRGDTSQWTEDSVKAYLIRSSGEYSKAFFDAFFNWDSATSTQAHTFVADRLTRFGVTKRAGHDNSLLNLVAGKKAQQARTALASDMLNGEGQALFRDRWQDGRPVWFTDRTLHIPGDAPLGNAVQRYMSAVAGKVRAGMKKDLADEQSALPDPDNDDDAEVVQQSDTPATLSRVPSNSSLGSVSRATKRLRINNDPSVTTQETIYSIHDTPLLSGLTYQVIGVQVLPPSMVSIRPHSTLHFELHTYGSVTGLEVATGGFEAILKRALECATESEGADDDTEEGSTGTSPLKKQLFFAPGGSAFRQITNDEELVGAFMLLRRSLRKETDSMTLFCASDRQMLEAVPPRERCSFPHVTLDIALGADGQPYRETPADDQGDLPHDDKNDDQAADDSTSRPADDAGTSPAGESETHPADESQTNPADESQTNPADESQTNPADQRPAKPADESAAETADESGPTADTDTHTGDAPGTKAQARTLDTPVEDAPADQAPTINEPTKTNLPPVARPTLYPYMVRALPSHVLRSTTVQTRDTPTVQVGPFTKVPWLSTNYSKGASGQEEVIDWDDTGVFRGQDGRALYHLNNKLWVSICGFMGFDTAEDDPQLGVYFPGWKEATYLQAYQFYTVGWLIRRFLQGEEFSILAHSMGLGKTAITLATAKILHMLIEKRDSDPPRTDNTATVNLSPEPALRYMEPYILADRQGPGSDIALRHGPMLFLAPSSVVSVWIQEYSKFTTINRDVTPIKRVIAWGNPPKADFNPGGRFAGMYRTTDTVRTADRPTPAALIKAYGRASNVPDPLTVADVLTCTEDFRPEPWQHSWWVFTTPDTLARADRFLPPRATHDGKEGSIDAAFSYVFFDEFQHNRTATSDAWTAVSGLRGPPQMLFISGTPMTKLQHLVAPMLAAQHTLFEAQLNDGTTTKDLYSAMRPTKDRSKRISEVHIKPIVPGPRRSQLRTANWFTIYTNAGKVDTWRQAKVSMTKQAAEEEEDHTLDIDTMPEDRRTSLKHVQAAYTYHTIQFPTELLWSPFPGSRGLPAVAIPPHATYMVPIEVNERHQKTLGPLWDALATKGLLAGKGGAFQSFFFSTVQRFQVYALVPELAQWMTDDAALRSELGTLTLPSARHISKEPKTSRLWHYMPRINNTPAMRKIRIILEQARSQKNWLGTFPRKVTIICFVPMNVAIISMYLLWLVEHPTCTALTSEEQLTVCATWDDEKRRTERIEAFRTTKDAATYDQDPGIITCGFRAVGTGISLDPADVLISPDSTWLSSDLNQMKSRVNRSAMVQKAAHTEAFLIRPNARFCPVHYLLNRSQESAESLQAIIKEHITTSTVTIE